MSVSTPTVRENRLGITKFLIVGPYFSFSSEIMNSTSLF